MSFFSFLEQRKVQAIRKKKVIPSKYPKTTADVPKFSNPERGKNAIINGTMYSSDTPALPLKRVKLTKNHGTAFALHYYRKIVLVEYREIYPTTFGTVSWCRAQEI
jgi:hypothetical protein